MIAPVGRRVLHYVARWLPRSEPFVHTLVTRSTLPGAVVSRERPENPESFPFRPVTSLGGLDRVPARHRRSATTAALMAVAVRHRAGLVHVHFGYRLPDVLGAAGRLRLPLVVSLWGHDVTGFLADHPEHYRRAWSVVDAVVVPSRFLAARAEEAGADPAAVHVLPTGIDTGWFTPTPLPADPVVLFVGRFVEKKGLDVLRRAWPAVREAVPGARLRLLGFGTLEPAVAGLAGSEIVRGGRREVRDELARARVLVSPSRTAADGDAESLLYVNLEAQAAGRPVVTTDHAAVPEFVRDGETAVVVPEGDAGALARALVAVLADDALARRLAAGGPAWAARFDAGRCAARLDDLYGQLLARRPEPGRHRRPSPTLPR